MSAKDGLFKIATCNRAPELARAPRLLQRLREILQALTERGSSCEIALQRTSRGFAAHI